MNDKRKNILLLIFILVGIAVFVGGGLSATNWQYFLSRRIPKVIAIILTGGAIAYSSLVFQTITHNRILTPNVLGFDAIYIFIQTSLVFVFAGGKYFRIGSIGNFLLTLMLMMLVSSLLYRLIFKKERQNIMFLVLVGMVTGTFFKSISDGMQFVMDPNEFLNLQDSMYASFNTMNTRLIIPSACLMLGALFYVRHDVKLLDVVALGREQAMNLGVDYDKVVRKMLIVVAMLVSVSTALVGPVSFLGILVANLARQMITTYKHSTLLTTSILIGVASLIWGQWMIERVLGFNVMLSMIINLVGGTYFLYILLKESRL